MAWTVDGAFDEFHTTINLPGDHRTLANTRKDWIVRRLGPSFTILDAFTIGSIPRFTALEGSADLDVLVVLHWSKHIKDRQPSTVLPNVKAGLGAGAGSVRRNGQAVTMKFQSWPDVDVVPASRTMTDDGKVKRYSIPDMNRQIWLSTKPRLHASQISRAASERGSKFRQIIKMIKDWNRRQTVRLQSYHIEVIALQMGTSWEDYSWAIFKWFEAAEPAVSWCWHEDQDVSAYLDYAQANRAAARLREMRSIASDAYYATYATNNDHAKAIRLWKSIFGQRFPGYG